VQLGDKDELGWSLMSQEILKIMGSKVTITDNFLMKAVDGKGKGKCRFV